MYLVEILEILYSFFLQWRHSVNQCQISKLRNRHYAVSRKTQEFPGMLQKLYLSTDFASLVTLVAGNRLSSSITFLISG